jgi:Mrp family chromosome partitioning ATPase
MSTLAECLRETEVVPDASQVRPISNSPVTVASSTLAATEDEQVRALVERLFFRADTPLRHVAFVSTDPDTDPAPLVFAVARVLAEEGSRDIGLIDASPRSEAVHLPLGIAPGSPFDPTWQIAPRLWIVPCQSWFDPVDSRQIPGRSLSRLRDLISEFDCSVLRCAPASWLAARLAQVCDGAVLVLTAHKTRRTVAAQIGDSFHRARIPLLGTVLIDRRFPVPERLYRSL